MIDRLIERYRDALLLIARILLMSLFIISGFGKLIDFDGTVHYMEYVHAPMPAVSATIATIMEFAVGAAVLFGFQVRLLALLLMVFVAGTALIGHPFWTMEAAERSLNQVHFLKNMAIMGGLLLLAITGAGRYSLTRR
ncbi:DoxX family protein [Dokdonella fugitiva]|jgi:putative oxidoreductase|uniref:Putative oxidoreductase n=1 Tax=Dokdonella fugitiva TaxID=328517 RepID=A0A4R2IBN2_9GAMM|nr:DoxX family protein [Dokdonella fugitiva]MBA8884328.1 putative oxidoreductase [Dokdonella fugitiva]TCO39935.1 putative oxidoreductase [Dokdonella fugitiva]